VVLGHGPLVTLTRMRPKTIWSPATGHGRRERRWWRRPPPPVRRGRAVAVGRPKGAASADADCGLRHVEIAG